MEVCRWLMANFQGGNCSLTWRHHNGKLQFDCVKINGKGEAAPLLHSSRCVAFDLETYKLMADVYLTVTTSLANQYYEEITMVTPSYLYVVCVLRVTS